jgi:pyruvate formate lyase activating enzyme
MSENEAEHWEQLPGQIAGCRVCPHRCDVAPEAFGKCGVRENLNGLLYVTNYEELTRADVEPIERVPLYHFRPGTRVLALGSFGESFPPEIAPPWRPAGIEEQSKWYAAHETIDIAVSHKVDGIAYSGGEPFMWLEQWKEIATAARSEKLMNVAITNGFALEGPRAEIIPLLDAVNLAILGPDSVYRLRVGPGREAVLDTARALHAAGVHLEITYLVLQGENDGPKAFEDLVEVLDSLGNPPLHVASPIHFETAAPVLAVRAAYEALRPRVSRIYLSPIYGGDPPPR